MKTKKTAPEGQNSPMRQTAQGVACDAGFAFVVVRTREVGIRGSFRTRLGPMSMQDAFNLANYWTDASGTGWPQILTRTNAEAAEKGWGGLEDAPHNIRRILEAENARIREANALRELPPPSSSASTKDSIGG